MSEVKQKCQLNDCHRAASTLCYCCNKSICTRHFTEHIDIVRKQVDPLADEINRTAEKIQAFTIEQLTEIPLAKLDQWKSDMHQLVDEMFLNRKKEVDDLVEKNKDKFVQYKVQQWENVLKIQEDVKQLAEDGDATFQQIQLLKQQLAKIEERQDTFQTNFLSINTKVFGQEFVTISSTLNEFPINSNTALPTLANVPSNHGFGQSTSPYQLSGFQNASGALSFGSIPTTTHSGGWSFPSEPLTTINNPCLETEESTSRRPVLKARRVRP